MNTRSEATLDSLIPTPSESSPSLSFRSNKAFPLREMLPVVLIVAVDFMGLGIVVPLLPFYTERTGASAFTVGTLISVFAFCQFLAGPVLGQLSDRLGRKPILLVSQLGSLVGYVLFALSNSLWLIFLSRIIDGLSAGKMSVAQAYVSDNTTLAERTRGFTFHDHPFNPANIGLVFTYVALINILVQISLMKSLTRRFSEEHLLSLGFLLLLAGFVGVGFCTDFIALLPLLTVANIGASILRPLVLSQLSKRVSPGKQGAVMGVNQSVFSVCAILAPLLSGGLISRGMYSLWAWSVAIFGCVGLLIAAALKPQASASRNE